MNQIVLQRKLTAPNTTNLVNRPTLVEKLSIYCQSPLTVISAPAGYGKTSLVSDWLRFANHPVYWLTLDKQNNLPTSFWLHLSACLKKIDPALGSTAEKMLDTHFVEDYCLIADLVLSSIEDLGHQWNCPNKAVVVLDDFQFIDHPQIIESVNRFIDYLPSWLQLVITTRTLPNLMLPNRCSKSKAHIIRANELVFNQDQIIEFLALKLDLALNRRDALSLLKQTEGWAAAIQLTGLALKAGSRVEDCSSTQDSLLADFLFQEVFSQLALPAQELLLEVCHSNTFNLDLCQRFNAQRDNLGLLETLTSQGMFVSQIEASEDKQISYRLHSLFRQWLIDNNPLASDLIIQHKSIIISWLDEQQEYHQAIELCIELKQWQTCARLMANLYPSLIQIKHFDYVSNILNRIPKTVLSSQPNLCLLAALIHFSLYDYEKVKQYTSNIESLFQQEKHHYDEASKTSLLLSALILQGQVARYSGQMQLAQDISNKIETRFDIAKHELHCWVITGKAVDCFFNDDINQAIIYAQTALDLARSVNDTLCAVTALGWLLHGLYHNGQILHALKLGKENLIWLQQRDFQTLPNASSIYAAMTTLYTENNQLDLAWSSYQELTSILNNFTDPREVIYNKFHTQYHLFSSSGQFQQAETCLNELDCYENSLTIKPSSQTSILLDSQTLRVLLEAKKGNSFPLIQLAANQSSLMEDQPEAVNGHYQFRSRFETMIYTSGQMLISAGEHKGFIELANQSEDSGNTHRQIACYLIPAKILFSMRQQQQGLMLLQKALGIAKQSHFTNLIIEDETLMLSMLTLAIEEGIEADYCRVLLADIQNRQTWIKQQATVKQNLNVNPLPPSINNQLIETLSKRELEVLNLINQGHRNQQVAELLSLSLSTIKRHLQNIYQKLQVNSRTEAIALLNKQSAV